MAMRIGLEKALQSIKEKVFKLFDITKQSICLSIRYLLEEEERSALERIKDLEKKSDIVNLDIQEECMTILVRQQPVAKDARFVIAIMEISSFFERINDLSLEVSELHPAKIDNELSIVRDNIMWMIKRITHMIDINEEGLRTGKIVDIDKKLMELDDDIDRLFEASKNYLIEYLKKSRENVEDAVKLLYIIRHLERIGDIVAKTGSRIIYIERGRWVFIK